MDFSFRGKPRPSEGPLRADGLRIAERRIDDGEGPALEWVEARPAAGRTGAPLLFLHGAFGGAWMWSEAFLPFFAKRGRTASAFSLRGHGHSEGRAQLPHTTLADYVTDLRRAIAALPEPPVLVAHSLGALVAQRLIGREHLRGVVLLAPVPPEGMLFLGGRIAAAQPVVWLEAFLRSIAGGGMPIVSAARHALFSERLPRARVARYAAMMTPESPRALADAHMPAATISAFLFRIPVLVVAAAQDRVVPRGAALRTAFYHAGSHRTIEGSGHALMLDVSAERCARLMADWLEGEGL